MHIIKDLVFKSRSYRRFEQGVEIEATTLRELVDMARLCPSGGNLQPLKYILSCDSVKNELIFPHLRWAAYLRDWSGPAHGERPAAYVVILGDTDISTSFGCDHGIAAQTILLGATEKGLGGCIIGSIDRAELMAVLNISSRFEILLVIALGKPSEKVLIEKIGRDGSIRYWRDEEGRHIVPKRSLEELIIG